MAQEDRYNRGRDSVTLGVPWTFNIPARMKVLMANLILDGTVTIAGGTTNGTVVGENAVLGLIQRITVTANKAAGSRYRGGELVKCRPQSLVRFAITERNGKFIAESFGNNSLGNGAAGAYPVRLNIPIYFSDTTNLNNVQTALNMDAVDSSGAPIYSAVQCQVDFCSTNASDIFYGSDRTISFAGTCQWKDLRLAIASDTQPLVQEDHLAVIQAASPEYVDRGMPNDGFFNQILLLEQAGGPEWQLADTILNKLTIKSPTLNYFAYKKDITEDMINLGFWDPSTATTGQDFIDFTHGLLANSNDASQLQHQLDVNNPSGASLDRFLVYTRRFFPLPAAQ